MNSYNGLGRTKSLKSNGEDCVTVARLSHEIKLVYSAKDIPNITRPRLVCGFPGSGYVGKLAIDHLIQELNAKKLADIYTSAFPPQVMIREDGTIELMKNSIYWWSNEKTSLLLLTGDSQPANPDAEYALAEEILSFAKQFDTAEVFTLAAYITGLFVDKPKVFGTATDPEIIGSFDSRNIIKMDGGSITGMNGLILGISRLSGMRGTCLLGETSGYVVDAKASKAVLEVLLPMLDIQMDMTNLEKRAKDTELLIQTIEQQMGMGKRGQFEGQQMNQKPRDTGYIA